MTHRLILRHCWALGDTVLLSALVRDIQLAYPGKYAVDVETNWTPVWLNNPYITRFSPEEKLHAQKIVISWGKAIGSGACVTVGNKRERRHILGWYHYDFTRQTGVTVPITEARGELYLTEAEQRPLLRGRYWVMFAGGKRDTTIKIWNPGRYQEVVDGLLARGIHTVQCGSLYSYDTHQPLQNCLNLLGKTNNVRDMFNLLQHCEGVICPVTSGMHIAAVFQKPCVVIAGGREEPWFEHYTDEYVGFTPTCRPVAVPHRFLHSLGALECSSTTGCWKDRVVPIEPSDLTPKKKNRLCLRPKQIGEFPIAACMERITAQDVIEAVMSYTYTEPKREAITQIQPPPELVRAFSGPPISAVTKNGPPKEYQPVQPKKPDQFRVLDNPIIGGRYTVCVLCYGPYPELAERCLNSILTTVPRDRMDLRVATNAAVPETVEFLRSIQPDQLYIHEENRFKYPVMREMFHDPAHPLTTPYLIWFDDDAYAVDPKWLIRLTETIIPNHKAGNRLYGIKMFHDMRMFAKEGHRPDMWFREAPWFQGRAFCNRQGVEAPNGSCIPFAVGWFWAISTDVIRAGDIPDRRLGHNGGDCTIGEQVHQRGFHIKVFNEGKKYVFTPAKNQGGRRGHEESFPWSDPASRFSGPFPAKSLLVPSPPLR